MHWCVALRSKRFFLEKAEKTFATAIAGSSATAAQKFFGSFFEKRTASLALGFACVVSCGALAACARSDQELCAGKGYAAGSDGFNDCLSHQATKHAMLEQRNLQNDRAMRNTASQINSAMGGVPGLSTN